MSHTAFQLQARQDGEPKAKSPNEPSANRDMAKKILAEIMRYRRVPEHLNSCDDRFCSHCSEPHLPKIISAIERKQAITFVLPAFPGKSPNPEKVLGYLPDYAEELALQFLHGLSQTIKAFYPPGIKIIICSDGRVFSDVIGMKEEHITAYQLELDRLIKSLSLSSLSTYNLDDLYDTLEFTQMRSELMQYYGEPLDFLQQKIRNGAQSSTSQDEIEANRMYRGMTRFLFEDSLHEAQTKSRTALQKDARARAYEVIRRSNAWSKLIAERFPKAVRLSIHPQSCGAKKLGIRLIANESWMTPWHGVAVRSREGYRLLKRSEAEALGAKLVCAPDGRHSHYQLVNEVMEVA